MNFFYGQNKKTFSYNEYPPQCLLRGTVGQKKVGYSHIPATDFLFYLNTPRPPLRQPCPLLWAGAHAIHFVFPVYLVIQRHHNRGAKSGGAKPRERLASLVPVPGTLFRSEFWNRILATFFLVISFTSWWLKWHDTQDFFLTFRYFSAAGASLRGRRHTSYDEGHQKNNEP
jgi:hypothetical protein